MDRWAGEPRNVERRQCIVYAGNLMVAPSSSGPLIVGRYALHGEIASGGMATIHVGRLMGPVGFTRTVAIKRLHPSFAKDPEFVAMFMDEARLASRVRHPNVVPILDVVASDGELLLVMEYVAGESLSRLIRLERKRARRVPVEIAVRIVSEVLAGLHAAHEAKTDRGMDLGLVHRDVSPQNALVGEDGISHLIDFGVAKAAGRVQTTREGQLKGKLAYMAPEQIRLGKVDRRTDIYSAGAVLWEVLTGRRLFDGAGAQVMFEVLTAKVAAPSSLNAETPAELDAIVMKSLDRDPTCGAGPQASGGSCWVGVCLLSCGSGWGDCDSDPDNGCETNELTDEQNCGGCGKVCVGTCESGICTTPDAGVGDAPSDA